jgi:hypothetical protein
MNPYVVAIGTHNPYAQATFLDTGFTEVAHPNAPSLKAILETEILKATDPIQLETLRGRLAEIEAKEVNERQRKIKQAAIMLVVIALFLIGFQATAPPRNNKTASFPTPSSTRLFSSRRNYAFVRGDEVIGFENGGYNPKSEHFASVAF